MFVNDLFTKLGDAPVPSGDTLCRYLTPGYLVPVPGAAFDSYRTGL
jgi:hypothetical protein